MTGWTNWIKLPNRNTLPNLQYPGVYAIAVSESDKDNTTFKMCSEIAYFGMTNSKGGLRSRLQQFDNTIQGKEGHGGAKKFRKKYPDYNELEGNLYVAVKTFECAPSSNKHQDLLIMGKVAEFEYICFAEYVRKFSMLPEFNDKARSPKS